MKTDNTRTDNTTPALSCRAPAPWKIVAAFAAIYLIWGSTFLAIRYGVQSIPAFLLAGSRFVVAGGLLYGAARLRGAKKPTEAEWRDAAISGALLLMIGNGCVTWAELYIPSSVAALLVALVPVWMVLLDWLRPTGVRPRPLVFAGLAAGLLGVALISRGSDEPSSGHFWAVIAMVASSLAWAAGSIHHRQARKPDSALLAIGMQMLCGGASLLALSFVRGEMAAFSWTDVTAVSVAAWVYLTIIGSLIGFTAYVWLLQVSTPARVSTYAYVCPFIAVLLGCTIGREPLSDGLFLAGGLIVIALALIVRSSKPSGHGRSAVLSPPKLFAAERMITRR